MEEENGEEKEAERTNGVAKIETMEKEEAQRKGCGKVLLDGEEEVERKEMVGREGRLDPKEPL